MFDTDRRTTLLIFLFSLSIILAALAGSIPGYIIGAKKTAVRAGGEWYSAMTALGGEWESYSAKAANATKDVYLAGVKDAAKYVQDDLGVKCDEACVSAAKAAPAVLSSNTTHYGVGFVLPDWAEVVDKVKLSSEMSAQGNVKDMTVAVKWDLRTDESFSSTHLLIALGMILLAFVAVMVALARVAMTWKRSKY